MKFFEREGRILGGVGELGWSIGVWATIISQFNRAVNSPDAIENKSIDFSDVWAVEEWGLIAIVGAFLILATNRVPISYILGEHPHINFVPNKEERERFYQ